MKKLMYSLYSIISYSIGMASLVYMTGFLGEWPVPKSVDEGNHVEPLVAILNNLSLIGIFALQHSVMARSSFKKRWVKWMPQPIERSTYVLLSGVCLMAAFWFWQPIPHVIWDVENELLRSAIRVVFWLGMATVVTSSFLINHFELFGLHQVYAFMKGRALTPPAFRTPFLYQIVRHPLQFGIFIMLWAAPTMTVGHLLFSTTMLAYVLVGLNLEEKELKRAFGETYLAYQQRVPMLVPIPRPRADLQGEQIANCT